jgi:hypothetical protein
MRNLRQLFQLKRPAWSLIAGLMLAGLLGGCHTPLIDIKVDVDNTCQTGGNGTRMATPEAGACLFQSYTGAIPTGTICKNAGGIIACPTGATCSSGTGSRKCRTTPGTCDGVSCKTYWLQTGGSSSTTGVCSCPCPQS